MSEQDKVFEQVDARIGKAMVEIRSVLEKHDLGGFVHLQSEQASEHATVFPSWSVAQLRSTQDGKQALTMAVQPTDPRKQELGEQTVGLLLTIRDVCAKQAMIVDGVMKQVAKHCGVDTQTLFKRSKGQSTHTVQ